MHGYIQSKHIKSSCGDVAVWVDTSGSVSDKEKKHALGELNAIAEDMQPNSVTIFYGDADVQNIERYERGDIIECLNSKGGGGTDLCLSLNTLKRMM